MMKSIPTMVTVVERSTTLVLQRCSMAALECNNEYSCAPQSSSSMTIAHNRSIYGASIRAETEVTCAVLHKKVLMISCFCRSYELSNYVVIIIAPSLGFPKASEKNSWASWTDSQLHWKGSGANPQEGLDEYSQLLTGVNYWVLIMAGWVLE